jgi:hypothetical protein
LPASQLKLKSLKKSQAALPDRGFIAEDPGKSKISIQAQRKGLQGN